MTNLYTEGEIKTFTGQYLNIKDPKLENLRIRDIIQGLMHQPRWMGQTRTTMSVLTHSVLVAMVTRGDKWEAFMHDASEAYLGDIAKPIKDELPDYQKLERKLMHVISEKYGFNYPIGNFTHNADRFLLELEFIFLTHQPHEIDMNELNNRINSYYVEVKIERAWECIEYITGIKSIDSFISSITEMDADWSEPDFIDDLKAQIQNI